MIVKMIVLKVLLGEVIDENNAEAILYNAAKLYSV